MEWVEALGDSPALRPATSSIDLGRHEFHTPSRGQLPPLERYARLERDGEEQLAGYVEASHGCVHKCRHCPVPVAYLDKGHTAGEAAQAVALLREHGIEIRPSWLPFTPWATPQDILEILDFVIANEMVGNVDPIQYTIRLLVPKVPHREKYLLIVTGFLRQLLELHLDLIDEVEQELQGEAATAPAPSADGPG